MCNTPETTLKNFQKSDAFLKGAQVVYAASFNLECMEMWKRTGQILSNCPNVHADMYSLGNLYISVLIDQCCVATGWVLHFWTQNLLKWELYRYLSYCLKMKKSVHMYTCIKCKQLVLDLFVKHTSKCYISDGLILLKVGFFRISKLVTPSSIGFF